MVVEFTDEKVENILRQTDNVNNVGFRKFLVERQKYNYFFDARTYFAAYSISKKLKQDYDHVTVICGLEGSGKSTFASLFCTVVSPDMNIHHVCYEPGDLIDALKISKKGDTVWIDEGGLFLFSREAMGKNNRRIVKLLTICRQLNLHVVICIPNFFIMDTYLRDHRVNFLFQVTKRGKFVFYNKKAVQLVSAIGKRTKNVSGVRVPNGTFYNGYYNNDFGVTPTFTKDIYEEKKSANMDKHLAELKIEYGDDDPGSEKSGFVSLTTFLKSVPIARPTALRMLNSGDIPGRKIGAKWFINEDYLSVGDGKVS